MKTLRHYGLLFTAVLVLSACSSHRITYSGHEESTEGMPGYVDGKKVSPNVKLGQSYTVDGDTYVPRFQPDYAEEGMASWYGPGFHGGKTANGEEFDKHSMTAAHPTLPLPSIVKVTMVETGKSVFVRINDRGPYARGRIIDLSYGAAKEIGLIAKGTAKVRVEYRLAESQRFADLLAQGRSPESIDLASDVLPYGQKPAVQMASNDPSPAKPVKEPGSSFMERINPIASAQAQEVGARPPGVAESVQSNELDPPMAANTPVTSAPAVTVQPRGDPAPAQVQPETAPLAAASPTAGTYLQLGSFTIRNNAAHLQQRIAGVGPSFILQNPSGSVMMYRVRIGPLNADELREAESRLKAMGIKEMAVIRQ